MKSEEIVAQAVRNRLESLSSRIKALLPTTICNIGDIIVSDSLQIYASFLKTPQSNTLDLCFLLKPTRENVVVSADLVKGGSGDVLSEMSPIISPSQENKFERFVNHIDEYILSQEDNLIQELRQGLSWENQELAQAPCRTASDSVMK